ncbi:anthocyanidin reductase ((2S)-flavan-3-ol-forming) [Iris pallida]|uniref:Anthocyanidin reductase ((2S)-flavan-3-ol-forming) n=1 Tax=Iris pallida TaxID=29817 RepID=A0AAX6H9Y6_IRIPA|nr:anthocyanidin reductase ((2S)-flavan-3-ol-forming) [Iris pallida]
MRSTTTSTRVTGTACVTGGNGFLAAILIKQLLEKGYAVNATVRNPEDKVRIGHLLDLRSLGNLELFRAELTEEGSFDEAVSGCQYVFHVAAPVNIFSQDPENELIKPAIEGTLNVMKSCLKAKVKRVVLTSSAAAVSVNRLGGTGLVVDEECWSDVEFLTAEKPPSWGYLVSKTLAEKEAWKFARENGVDLVSVVPPLMVGPPLSGDIPSSVGMALCLLLGDDPRIGGLKIMQSLSGSVSFVHVEDAGRAHVFVAEAESASGRYICCAVNTSLPELAEFLSKRYPQYDVPTNIGDVPKVAKLKLSSEKLIKEGFEFETKELGQIYDGAIVHAKNAGFFSKNGAT